MAKPPAMEIDTNTIYTITLGTSKGTIVMDLDPRLAPNTVNHFVALARQGFYTGLTFHRVVPGFVIQGGDPAGNGSGGPSWKVVEAPPASTKYTSGVVAMAKTSAEAPGTSGSQFFIVTAPDVGLPPEYAVAGKVVKGQKIADLIADQGTEGADGPPNKPVTIISATVDTK
jgi:cyclophilin family peptidyl-prolyl cis-trans isomerase